MVQIESVDDLSPVSIKILKTLDDHGGEATTSEIKNMIGEENRGIIHYRKNEYLEPAGLIETFQPTPESPGHFPPQEWSITKKGLEFLDDLETDSDIQRDIGARVEMMEDEISALREKLTEIESAGESNKSDTVSGGASEEQVAELASEIEALKREVNEIKTSLYYDENFQDIIDNVILISAISKEYMLSQKGEEWFDEAWDEQYHRDEIQLIND